MNEAERSGGQKAGRGTGALIASWLGWVGLGLTAMLIVVLLAMVATAAAVVSLVGVLAIAVLRIGSKSVKDGDPTLLEGRPTAEGWVVEARPH